jgi:hypothetical protein
MDVVPSGTPLTRTDLEGPQSKSSLTQKEKQILRMRRREADTGIKGEVVVAAVPVDKGKKRIVEKIKKNQ